MPTELSAIQALQTENANLKAMLAALRGENQRLEKLFGDTNANANELVEQLNEARGELASLRRPPPTAAGAVPAPTANTTAAPDPLAPTGEAPASPSGDQPPPT